MVDPRVCPPKADVELADVVRQFGPQYISQYGHRMMPSQKKALSDIAACSRQHTVGTILCRGLADICAMPSCVPVRFPGWHGGSDGQTTSTSFAAE